MSWSRTEPWVLASLITSVPQPSIRSRIPMSKATSLIRISGMSWPLRATSPSRVISRLVVMVYVEVSQSRNGRSTHHTNTTRATIQTSRLTKPSSTSRSRKTARASVITRTTPGAISAFGWVRVSTTTDSPSVSSFGEMATARSLSLRGAYVHHVTGSDGHARDHSGPGPAAGPRRTHDQAAVVVDLGRPPRQHRSVRQGHAHVALQCRAQGPVAGHERVRGGCENAQAAPQLTQHVAEEHRPVDGTVGEGQGRRQLRRQLVLGLVDVDADADHCQRLLAPVRPDLDALDQDPADLPVIEQHVVRPFQRAADRPRDGVPRSERDQGPPLVLDD